MRKLLKNFFSDSTLLLLKKSLPPSAYLYMKRGDLKE